MRELFDWAFHAFCILVAIAAAWVITFEVRRALGLTERD